MDYSAGPCGVAARSCDDQEETSSFVAAESKPTEWTDEKHSLYLKSMETTFVNQLYKSLDLIGRDCQKNLTSGSKSSKHKLRRNGPPSGQFKVLQDGCWSKVNFVKDEAEVNQDEKPGNISANPWIQHYTCPQRRDVRKFQTSSPGAPLSNPFKQFAAHNFQLCRQDPVGSSTEVTDQNFNDEDVEEEKPCMTHESKRTRSSTETIPTNDQVVPFEDDGSMG